MRKKIKYLLLLFGLIAVCPTLNVKAQTYQESFNDKSKWIPQTWINKTKGSTTKYQQLSVIARVSDGQFVYCIEPGMPLDSNQVYQGQDYDQSYVANMTQAQWRRIQLLAYYGYGYSDSQVNHTDLKWYSVTQFMIWQTASNGYDIYFTDSLNGNRITKYTSEMAEMEALLSKHYTTPDFGETNFETVIGQTLTLTDRNGVLSEYNVSSNSFITSNKNGNNLYLQANAVGNTNISLTKRDVKYSHPTIVYVKPNTQNVVQVGSYDPVENNININILGGKITAEKLDSHTMSYTPLGDAKLTGTVYGVYNEQNVRVGQITIGDNNKGTSRLAKTLLSLEQELRTNDLIDNYDLSILEEFARIQDKINIYIWCNIAQIKQYLDFFIGKYNCSYDILIWNKTNAMPLFNHKYLADKEYCLYFRKRGFCNPPTYQLGKTVFYLPSTQKEKKLYGHPTIKPLSIIETFVINSSRENETIADFFMGSGTTGEAVINVGGNRKFIGIEKSKQHFSTSQKRIKEAIKRKEVIK